MVYELWTDRKHLFRKSKYKGASEENEKKLAWSLISLFAIQLLCRWWCPFTMDLYKSLFSLNNITMFCGECHVNMHTNVQLYVNDDRSRLYLGKPPQYYSWMVCIWNKVSRCVDTNSFIVMPSFSRITVVWISMN